MRVKQVQGGLIIMISLAFCYEYYEKYPYSCCGIIILVFAILYSYTIKKQKKEDEGEPINRGYINFDTFSKYSEELDYDDIPRQTRIGDPSLENKSKPQRRIQATQQIRHNLHTKYREERRQNEEKQRIMDMYSQSQLDYDEDDEDEEEVNGFKSIKDIELSVCLLSDAINIRDPYAQMNKLKNIYNKLFLVRFLNQFSGLLYHVNLFSVRYYRIKISEYNYFYDDEYFNRGHETKCISLDELIQLTKKEQKFSLKIEYYLNQTKDNMEQYYDDRRQFMKDRSIIKLMWSMLDVNYSDRSFPLGHRKRVLERLIALKNGQSTAKYQKDFINNEPSDAEIILVTFFNLITVATKHETKKYRDTKLVLYYKLFEIKIIDKYEYDLLFNSKKLAPKAEDKYFVIQREYSTDISIHFYSAQISQIIKNFRKDEQETLLQGYAVNISSYHYFFQGNDNVYLAIYYYILSLKVYGLRRLDQMERLDHDTHFLLWILDFTKRL